VYLLLFLPRAIRTVSLIVWLPLLQLSAAADSELLLKGGPYLFLDDWLIASSSNVNRVIVSPKRDLSQPVVTAAEDQSFQPYVTVLRDPETRKYRMWYGVPVNGSQSHLAYIESNDGITWIRPHRVLEDPARIIFGASVLDEGAGFPDHQRRYKYVWYDGGMMLARSADGLQWTADPPQPVITGINDILHLARDTARDRYVAVFGLPSRPEDGYVGHTQNSTEGYRRCVGQSTSSDCLQWTKPRRIFAPDGQDEGITEFYSIGGVMTRGETIVGLLKVLRDDLPCDTGGKADGIGYTVLAWSHDGEHWQRDRAPLFDRNPQPGTWDHAMAWMDYQLPVGDEVYIYYGGYARGHKVERFKERQIGLVRIKRDRYVSRESAGAGRLRTRPFKLGGNSLLLNVDAAHGELRAQILERGRPIRGFGLADFAAIISDEMRARARWKRAIRELSGKTIQLEFELRDAKLFAIELEE
jgi:hypothetical protein